MIRKKTILLVDDDASFRFAIATELRVAGYIVQCAEDGLRAIRMTEKDHEDMIDIDLIITDLVMPRMDGLEFSTELRESHPDIHILVITGNLSEEAEKDLRSLGRIDFLEKPFTPNELLSRVEGMISSDTEISKNNQ
jgi:DNA-binding response OmpR family regulator